MPLPTAPALAEPLPPILPIETTWLPFPPAPAVKPPAPPLSTVIERRPSLELTLVVVPPTDTELDEVDNSPPPPSLLFDGDDEVGVAAKIETDASATPGADVGAGVGRGAGDDATVCVAVEIGGVAGVVVPELDPPLSLDGGGGGVGAGDSGIATSSDLVLESPAAFST